MSMWKLNVVDPQFKGFLRFARKLILCNFSRAKASLTELTVLLFSVEKRFSKEKETTKTNDIYCSSFFFENFMQRRRDTKSCLLS